jgi:hypothetical protein
MSFDKKLLFSGCSYTAGDELVWDKYCKDILLVEPIEYTWDHFHKDHQVFVEHYANYLEYRKNFNIPGQVGKALNKSVTDLSLDGNSNTQIALSVIKNLLEKTPEEVKDFHVCVGWTSLTRRLKWFEKRKSFANMFPHHYTNDRFSDLHIYIKEAIINVSVYDHNLQFINDVMLLENFLKARGISYTFWLSLIGMNGNDINDLKEKLSLVLPIEKISDRSSWLLFDESDPIPMLGTSWTDQLLLKTNPWVSSKNKHPNLESVTELAEKIASHLQLRFLDQN